MVVWKQLYRGMKMISVKCPTTNEKIMGILLGLVLSYAPLSYFLKHGKNFEFGSVIIGSMILALGCFLSCCSLYSLVFLRGFTFQGDAHQIRWKHIFRSVTLSTKEIKSFELCRSFETSGYMVIEMRNGHKFKVPGICYECKIDEVESYMYDILDSTRKR
jgi:hypothetical protein